ncbi:unnamed protein product [Trypanosoma congolense IL3000]|uniref:HECT-type E3 ubiquitin transferase n=1 Tax=Trypanosoma congolense (strain IL3000) TaxID=1068625 RepID=F9W790_TRYCI|nr:unnamed protein product [Trypanosoma congolense IL3000]
MHITQFSAMKRSKREEGKTMHLVNALFEAAKGLECGAHVLFGAFGVIVTHGATPCDTLVSSLYDLCATLPDWAVASLTETAEVRTILSQAVETSLGDRYHLPPTPCALSVLLGIPSRDTGPKVDESVNDILIKAIVSVTMRRLESTLSSPPEEILGKLVRFLPYFYYGSDECTHKRNVRRNWMRCLSKLLLLCSTNDRLIIEALSDIHQMRTAGTQQFLNFRHPSTYLFSVDYGLRLLEEGVKQRLTIPDAEYFCEMNLLCGIFIWPIYNFTSTSADAQREASPLISMLLHSPFLLRCLWDIYRSCHSSTFGSSAEALAAQFLENMAHGKPAHLLPPEPPTKLLESIPLVTNAGTRGAFHDPYPAVSVFFFSLMSYVVDATDFVEELDRGTVMDRRGAVLLILALKGILYRSFLTGVLPYSKNELVAKEALILLSKLHVINEAQTFVRHPSIWITTEDVLSLLRTERMRDNGSLSHLCDCVSVTIASDDDEEKGNEEGMTNNVQGDLEAYVSAPMWRGSCSWHQRERSIRLLRGAPFVVPFKMRAALLTAMLSNQEGRYYPGLRPLFVVRRGSVFADAFDRFAGDTNSGDMFGVRFRDGNDMMEEGYGEGVYREFLLSLCREGFAAEYGLFRLTDDGHVYPNPFSYEMTSDPHHLRRIKFLGAMLGRSLRDGVLQDIPFASHFRNAMLGRNNSIINLKSFDSQLYRHLVSLLTLSEEEIESLALNFTYTVDVLGTVVEVSLHENGRDIAVTRRNCMDYICRIADFRLNREAAKQIQAFQEGLESVVPSTWLRLFDSDEIRKLFAGDAECSIDVEDWMRHTQYHRPDDANSTPVQVFWQVVRHMSLGQQRKLLEFSTSMNRPPLLGFQFFNPPFKVHVLWEETEERLPSASTCFSTLKLPPYKEFEVARQKLIAAIEETQGFALS